MPDQNQCESKNGSKDDFGSDLKLHSKMILQVHDELVFDVHINEIEQMQQLVKKAMEEAVSMDVPMEVEMKTAPNWLEAH